MDRYGIKIANYKCFIEPIGFNEIRPINVVIDMIEFNYNQDKFCDECMKNLSLKILIDKTIDENDLGGFQKGHYSSWNT